MGNDVSFDRLVELTGAEIRLFLRKVDQTDPVSYTHLTLPTILLV